jgi:phage terminase large subunit-like protein
MTRAYIEATPWMAAAVNVRDWHKQIEVEATRSTWTALTSDARKAHGLAPSFWIADEVAQWRSRELWDNLATGMGKRRHALGVTISTQAADDLHFWSEFLDAEHGPSTYVQLHAAPADCALDDREAWKAANPALGHFLSLDQFEDAAARAMRSPSFEPSFRLLHLNARIDAEARFLSAADWDANGEPFDPLELEGARCFGGLDLSSTRDLCALALYFPDHGKLLAWHFVPADTMKERVERDRVPYDRWAADGWLTATQGRATDRLSIVRQLAEIVQSYRLEALAFDRWRFEDLLHMLNAEGIELPLVEFVPGFKSYAPAVDAFERLVLARQMQHNGNPLLRWQAGNVRIEADASSNRKPTKAKSLDRIDGIVAAMQAVGIAERTEPKREFQGAVAWL